jgi:acyl-CoA thioester hydrolase
MTHRVEFADTDMAGIIHFSSFFRYMEVTEHAFIRSLGFSIHSGIEGQNFGWPRVHVECDFMKPVRFEDEIEVELVVREKRSRSLKYDFLMRKLDALDIGEIARGSFTVVCVTWNVAEAAMRAVLIPEALAQQIEAEAE